MSEKTLKFGDVEVNKKESYASKQPIALNLVNVNQIVISDKFKHNDKGLSLAIKMMILLDLYVLFYLKCG